MKMLGKIHLGITLLLLILLIGFLVKEWVASGKKEPVFTTDRIQNEEYQFLANRLFSQNRNDIFVNFMPLRQTLREYIAKQQEKISLYFEYLPSGSSIGVNDTQEAEMASLAKLPTVIAVYDKISRGELSKNTKLTLQEKHINKLYGDFWKKGVGTEIPLTEAIEKTLVESDNTTYEMLYDLLSLDDKVRIFQQLDIRVELNGTVLTTYISSKAYASILKSLYLSSYLSKEDSNEILTILTKSKSFDGIYSGIDKGVPIAHKTGILALTDGIDVKNDCGIVYVPKRPYILCILIKGEDEKKSDEHMSYLSRMIYTYITAVNR